LPFATALSELTLCCLRFIEEFCWHLENAIENRSDFNNRQSLRSVDLPLAAAHVEAENELVVAVCRPGKAAFDIQSEDLK
jgi:hypothetical protein